MRTVASAAIFQMQHGKRSALVSICASCENALARGHRRTDPATRKLESTVLMATLLVVDDNPSVRDSLRFVFTAFGFTVVCAESGAGALALCDEHVFDAAIVDIHMPGVNGIDVCRELRAQAQSFGRDLPVWLITGAFTPDLTRHAADAGAVAILMKPFNMSTLDQEIRTRLGLGPRPS